MTVKKEIASTIPKDLRHSVYRFGKVARLEGYRQDFCPHEIGTPLWRVWCAGWADMDAELALSPLIDLSKSMYVADTEENRIKATERKDAT